MMGQKRLTEAQAGLLTGQAGGPTGSRRGTPGRIIGLLLIVLLAGDSAFADFLVQPMLLRLAVQPGRRYTRPMKLENSDPKEAETLTLRLAELTQKSDGAWTELRPDDPNVSKALLRSCMSWLTVPASEIVVGGYKIVPFNLQIDVPAGTKGFYFAAIVATTAPRVVTLANGTVAPVNMQIVVPVILEVQSTVMPHRISLTDLDIQYQPQTLDVDGTATPARNNLFLDVTNAGGTLSRLLPIVRLWNQSAGHWQPLSEVRFPETMIMPGAKLHLKQSAGQALPSGEYQLEAYLFIDGRRGDVLKKTIKFTSGDPMLVAPIGRASLRVQPAELIMDVLPGGARTMPLQVMNGSEEEIKVQAEVILPENMKMATTGTGVRGEELGCDQWVTLNPKEFSLRGHAQRSVPVMARMPREATNHRDYYATLRLHEFYTDGKPAGTREVLICVQNKKVTDQSYVDASVLTIAEMSPGRYLASASFTNKGAIYANGLACQGMLNLIGAGGGGASILTRFLMTSEAYGQTGILLPIESRSFSGVLDISNVKPGNYFVTTILHWPEGPADGVQKQITIEVSEQGGRKVARMVDLAGVVPQVIKL